MIFYCNPWPLIKTVGGNMWPFAILILALSAGDIAESIFGACECDCPQVEQEAPDQGGVEE